MIPVQLLCAPAWLLQLMDLFHLDRIQLLRMTIKQLLPMSVLKDTDYLVEIGLDSVFQKVLTLGSGLGLLQCVKVSAYGIIDCIC